MQIEMRLASPPPLFALTIRPGSSVCGLRCAHVCNYRTHRCKLHGRLWQQARKSEIDALTCIKPRLQPALPENRASDHANNRQKLTKLMLNSDRLLSNIVLSYLRNWGHRRTYWGGGELPILAFFHYLPPILPLQFIISKDGNCGLNYEHSVSEGIAVIRLIEHILKYMWVTLFFIVDSFRFFLLFFQKKRSDKGLMLIEARKGLVLKLGKKSLESLSWRKILLQRLLGNDKITSCYLNSNPTLGWKYWMGVVEFSKNSCL